MSNYSQQSPFGQKFPTNGQFAQNQSPLTAQFYPQIYGSSASYQVNNGITPIENIHPPHGPSPFIQSWDSFSNQPPFHHQLNHQMLPNPANGTLPLQHLQNQSNIQRSSISQQYPHLHSFQYQQTPVYPPPAPTLSNNIGPAPPPTLKSAVDALHNSEREDGEVSETDHLKPLDRSSRKPRAGFRPENRSGSSGSKFSNNKAYDPQTKISQLRAAKPDSSNSLPVFNNNNLASSTSLKVDYNENSSHQEVKRQENLDSTRQLPRAKLSSFDFIDLLYRYNIRYSELLKEDLDPDILAQLYKTLKLEIATQALHPDESLTKDETSKSKKYSNAKSGSVVYDAHPIASNGSSVSTVSPSDQLVSIGTDLNRAMGLAHKNPKPVPSAISPSSESKAGVPSKAVGVGQPKDRTDYIARLMAAKTNKVAPATPALPQLKEGASSGPGDEKAPLKAQSNDTKPLDKNVSQKASKDALLEKKKAQTELARKKMELLAASKRVAPPRKELVDNNLSIDASIMKGVRPTDDKDIADKPEYRLGSEPDVNADVPSEVSENTIGINGSLPNKVLKIATEDPIPGLSFDVKPSNKSSATGTLEAISHPSGEQVVADRKRPVASDFEDFSSFSKIKLKRQFGQSRYDNSTEEMIIEASDEESGDEFGESLNIGTSRSPSASATTPRILSRTTSRVETPLLLGSKLNLLKGLTGSSTPDITTPPMLQPASDQGGKEHLSRKEQEILALKKKIAAMELKKRKVKTSGDLTPSNHPASNNQSGFSTEAESDSTIARPKKHNSNIIVLKHSDVTKRRPVSTPKKDSTALPSTDLTDSDGNNGTPQWRSQRRAKIQSDLPALEETIKANLNRLENLRKEMVMLEEESREQQFCKEKWVEELRALDIEPSAQTVAPPQITLEARISQPGQSLQVKDSHRNKQEDILIDSSVDKILAEPTSNDEQDILAGAEINAEAAFPQLHPKTVQTIQQRDEGELSDASGDPMDMSDAESEPDQSQDFVQNQSQEDSYPINQPGNEHNPPKGPFDSSNEHEGDSSDDFYTSEPVCESPGQGAIQGVSQFNGQSKDSTLSPSDEATSSDSSGDEMDVTSDVEFQSASAEATSDQTELPRTIELAKETPEVTTSLSITHSPSATLTQDVSMLQPEPTGGNEVMTDGLAPNSEEVPPFVDQEKATIQVPPQVLSTSTAPNETYFSPYESPLRMFKAYRYHSDFAKDVTGAFRSMTYSHKIDPTTELCRFEAAGGICNDSQCPFQHFRDMILSDDMMLVQLGTDNPGGSEDEQKQWTEGLRLVLKDLRQRNTKDPDVVAMAIANYRREFLKDPSRVLKL